jgi:arylsulfatase A-like enzyme
VIAETTFARGANAGASGRMVRTERYKYVVYDQGAGREQLFDLKADPHEMNNLATNPEYHTELNEHRTLISAWAAETGDEFPLVQPA